MTSRLQNAEAAAACYEIIPYLEGLPDDDPRLEDLESIWEAGLVDPDRDHDKVRAAWIGFKGGPPAEPSAWLDAYVASYTGAGRRILNRSLRVQGAAGSLGSPSVRRFVAVVDC